MSDKFLLLKSVKRRIGCDDAGQVKGLSGNGFVKSLRISKNNILTSVFTSDLCFQADRRRVEWQDNRNQQMWLLISS